MRGIGSSIKMNLGLTVLPCFWYPKGVRNKWPTLASTPDELTITIKSFVMPSKKTTIVGFVLAPIDQNQDEEALLQQAWSQKRKVIDSHHKMKRLIERSTTSKSSNNKWRSAKRICFGFPTLEVDWQSVRTNAQHYTIDWATRTSIPLEGSSAWGPYLCWLLIRWYFSTAIEQQAMLWPPSYKPP